MIEKLKALAGSVRFWIIVLTATLAILNGQPLIETVQVALAAIVTVGSVDSFATKLSSKKEEK